MRDAKWFLWTDSEGWKAARVLERERDIVPLEADSSMGSDDMAHAIAQRMRDHGYDGGGIMLGLPSEQCLSAAVELSSADVRDRNALMYELEEKLPLSLEDLVADFVVTNRHSKTALGVAVATQEVASFVNDLERAGVIVQSISPVSLLALQHILVDQPSTSGVVLWKNGTHLEAFTIRDGQPIDWRILLADAKVLKRELRIVAMSSGARPRVQCCQRSSELIAQLEPLSELSVEPLSEFAFESAAAATSWKTLTGRVMPWVELRRGLLTPSDPYRHVRGSISTALFVITVSIVVLCASLLMRAQKYGRLAKDHQRQQQAVFAQIFPGQTTPVGIQSRLASEKAKLAVVAGQSTDLPERPSALLVLYHLLSALPHDTDMRLEEILLDDGNLFLNGQVNSHSDAARIASALRNGGFDVEPPRSEQLSDQAVMVRINATWNAQSQTIQRTILESSKPQIVKQP
jgi:type II secretory pathway component PulL